MEAPAVTKRVILREVSTSYVTCIMTYIYDISDNYTLTRIRPDDPQAKGWGRDEDNLIYETGDHNEEEIEYGRCKIPLCYPKFATHIVQPSQACSGYMWTSK